jgi:peroxiredoxin-like protein
MQAFPHHYNTVATANADDSTVTVKSQGLPDIATDAPKEFDGPGDKWSPEALLIAAVADCFILTFRAIARGSGVDWHAIDCDATGKLDRVERVNRFTDIELNVRVSVPAGADHEKVIKVLHKSEQSCLITNSMSCEISLNTEISET